METPLQIMKQKTQPWHDRLEQVSHAQQIMDQSLTLPQLKDLFLAHYKLHSLLELDICKTLEPIAELVYHQRLKLAALDSDLAQLKLTRPPVSMALKPQIDDLSVALGYAYVLEGSSLGGAVIQRQLNKHADLQFFSSQFYQFYGSQLRERWLDFVTITNRLLISSGETELAVRAAIAAFQLAYIIFDAEVSTDETEPWFGS